MTRTARSAGHRSKKKRIGLVLAPVTAIAIAIPLMNQAGAATPLDVTEDCKSSSEKLESCDFVDVQFKKDNLGPNQRVSSVTDNCGKTTSATETFRGSYGALKIFAVEEGFVADGGFELALPSIFAIGGKVIALDINITRDDKGTSDTFSRSDVVKPDHIGFYMWSAKRTDVSGYLKATYKEEQDGRRVLFSPSEGGTSVHAFYPQVLKGKGTPDGRLWLRNVQCGTPKADEILSSAAKNPPASFGPKTESGSSRSLSLRAEPRFGEADDRVEPGFGEAGSEVTDVEIPLSEL